jgi:hypothetical protein
LCLSSLGAGHRAGLCFVKAPLHATVHQYIIEHGSACVRNTCPLTLVALGKMQASCSHAVWLWGSLLPLANTLVAKRRIAWLCAVQLNRLLARLRPGTAPCFKYRVSGGDEALIVSKELPEDDPHLGASDLRDAVAGYDQSFVFGVTCGLSAPYVAGQIDAAMSIPGCTAVLVGFNPIELARDVPVEGWDKRCAEVFRELDRRAREGDPCCHVLNPGASHACVRPLCRPHTVLLSC